MQTGNSRKRENTKLRRLLLEFSFLLDKNNWFNDWYDDDIKEWMFLIDLMANSKQHGQRKNRHASQSRDLRFFFPAAVYHRWRSSVAPWYRRWLILQGRKRSTGWHGWWFEAAIGGRGRVNVVVVQSRVSVFHFSSSDIGRTSSHSGFSFKSDCRKVSLEKITGKH